MDQRHFAVFISELKVIAERRGTEKDLKFSKVDLSVRAGASTKWIGSL